MIRLSENVLTSSISLLKLLNTYQFSSLSELSYSRISSISAEAVFEFAASCGWVSQIDGKPYIAQTGKKLLKMQENGAHITLKRQMLMDYVLMVNPIWSNRIPYGRNEAAIFMSKDEKACFSAAGLLSNQLNPGIIEWWDTAAAKIRAKTQQVKNNIGRIGERNTFKYERNRTNSEPKWMSIESNLVGYDIMSKLSADNPAPLLIEVKASTLALDYATFYITSHEWNVALTSDAYVFHLWCLHGSKKLLAVISPDDVQPYIPTNNLTGEWESAKIPFLSFEKMFIEMEGLL